MADSLVLTGSKTVTKHTGTEMVRLDDRRGGNTWQLPRWWAKGNGTVYTACTVFKVTSGGNSVYLAIEASSSLNLRIDHDAFNFTFYGINEASRAALYTDSWQLIEHYVFPRISGGKVMTVVPAGAASKPGAAVTGPAVSVTLVGTVSTEDDGSFTANTTGGNGSGLQVSYDVNTNVAENLAIVAGGTGYEEGDTFTVVGDTGVTGTISLSAAPAPSDVNVTINSADGTDAYILSGDAVGSNAAITIEAGGTLTITNNIGAHPLYIKTATGTGTDNQVPGVTGQGATNGDVVWDTTGVAPGTYYYQCSVHADMNGTITVS